MGAPGLAFETWETTNLRGRGTRSLTVCCCTKIWVPQVRRVFVFAPNLGYHEPQPEQNHTVRDLGEWKIDAERGGVSSGSRSAEAQNGCASLGAVDGVSRVRYRVTAMTRIRRDRGIKAVDERLVEEQLRRIRAAGRRGIVGRPETDVDVRGSPGIPTRHDGGEGDPAGRVGQLIAAQPALAGVIDTVAIR